MVEWTLGITITESVHQYDSRARAGINPNIISNPRYLQISSRLQSVQGYDSVLPSSYLMYVA